MSERMPDYPPEYDQDGRFVLAEKARQYILSNHRTCCDGWRGNSWFFHGKGWECSYPSEEEPFQVCVEMGVTLDLKGGGTYWIFDNDSTTMGEDYGETIPYPEDDEPEEWEKWHTKLVAQLDQAAEAAWSSDVLTCSVCGYHYLSSMEPQCCPEEED